MNNSFIFNNIWQIVENTYNFILIYPDIFLITILMINITYLVILDYIFKNKFILTNIAKILTLLTLIISFFLVLNNYFLNLIAFNGLLFGNKFNYFVKLILIFVFIILLFLSINYLIKENMVNFEYFILLLLVLLGLFMITSAYDLLSLYLAIELQSLCFYILATLKNYTNFSSEAGIKYFILGAFSSGLLLFGSSIIYGFTGLTDFYNLELFFQNQGINNLLTSGLTVGFIFIISGLLFKISAAPFHMWAPDVYEGSPTIITAIFSIVPKIAILTLFSQIFIRIFNQNIFYVNQFLLICGVLSLVVGTFGALYQVKLKRLLAYSGISHVGFILIGLSIISIESFYSFLFYVLIYMVLSLNIFALLLSFRKWINNLKIKKINEVIFLSRSNMVLAVIFSLSLFSLAGIPPLVGFYSKFYVFMAGLKSNYYLIIILAAIVSVISSMYYIRLIKLLFFRSYNYCFLLCNVSYINSIIISFTFLFNFFFLFWPNLIITYLNNITLFLFL